MLLVISGTNRPASNSLKVARLMVDLLREQVGEEEVRLLDLEDLPADLFRPEAYGRKPEGFAPFQEAVLRCRGMITIVAEYNGSFPGALKYFIDMLSFPESFKGLPCGFVGISAGTWGGLRAVEQLEKVFQYRYAHLCARRAFLPKIHEAIGADGALRDPELVQRLRLLADDFVDFARRVGPQGEL